MGLPNGDHQLPLYYQHLSLRQAVCEKEPDRVKGTIFRSRKKMKRTVNWYNARQYGETKILLEIWLTYRKRHNRAAPNLSPSLSASNKTLKTKKKKNRSSFLLERKRINIHITEKHMLLVGAI